MLYLKEIKKYFQSGCHSNMKSYHQILNESDIDSLELTFEYLKYVNSNKNKGWKITSPLEEKPKRARNILYRFKCKTPKGREVEVTYNKFYKSVVIKTKHTKLLSKNVKDLDNVDKTYDVWEKHMEDVNKSVFGHKKSGKEKPATPIKEKRKSRLPNFREHGNYLHMWVDNDGDMWIKNDEIHNKFMQMKELSDVNYRGSNWDGLNDTKLMQFYYAKKK